MESHHHTCQLTQKAMSIPSLNCGSGEQFHQMVSLIGWKIYCHGLGINVPSQDALTGSTKQPLLRLFVLLVGGERQPQHHGINLDIYILARFGGWLMLQRQVSVIMIETVNEEWFCACESL